MSGEKPKGAVEVIHPPNKIKARVGPAGKGMDPNLLARAEAAMVKAQEQVDFPSQANPELARAAATVALLLSDRENQAKHLSTLFNIVHDLRGGGGNFGYPLVTRIGGMLCRYLEGRTTVSMAEVEVLRSLVDAMRAVVGNKLKGDGGSVGQELCTGLERLIV
ncbi:MAG: Hpt domain-containing protein [Alphaproteobacteria bacterium]|nr:Hpt domain-containing protein [Alphaproteobacteria bacterium]